MNEIAANIAELREKIAAAAARAGRSEKDITLVAVSKTMPIELIQAALEAGIQDFGENRVEEAENKIPALHATVNQAPRWHMIGHIQSRKVKSILPLFDVVHSVERFKIAQKLSEAAQEAGKVLPIFLEINVSGEEAKDGFQAVDWQKKSDVKTTLWEELGKVFALPSLEIRGLMTMAPYTDELEATRPVFAELAALREALRNDFQKVLPDLSMGMTNDYTVAIEEGATIVRIGRAIFGERPVK
jgi:pyridoxal phosphate enzyme (YggS family)